MKYNLISFTGAVLQVDAHAVAIARRPPNESFLQYVVFFMFLILAF